MEAADVSEYNFIFGVIVQQKRVLSGEEAECLLQLGLSVERQLLLQGGGV